jgi:hypothetical protein
MAFSNVSVVSNSLRLARFRRSAMADGAPPAESAERAESTVELAAR